tara:strand:- start:9079 stop:10032 length:954 start_codon:yes stop_codon:yes gene_type:complete
MNSQKTIIFMGTTEFAIPSLKKIIENNYNVLTVVTSNDKPAGRGLKLKESPIKQFAKKNGLKILQPNNLKDQNFINLIRSFKPDLIVVVAFRMLPEILWEIPKYGTINVHASLLPEYRGAAPINWAIINGESQTGVSTFFINNKIDTGDIIDQSLIEINTNENAADIHDRLMELGGNILIKSLEKIFSNKQVVIKKQIVNKPLNKAPKLDKLNSKINWHESSEKIYNKIRGLSPYPGAKSVLDNYDKKINVIIYKSSFSNNKHNHPNGSIIIEKDRFKVATFDGYINPILIKFEGKKTLDIKSLINGFNFHKRCKMI